MFESLGRGVYRRRHLVLALAGAFVAVAVVWGTGVFGSLTGGGFEDPDSDSARAAQRAEQVFGRNQADVVALYSSPTLTVDDPAFKAAVQRNLAALPREHVARTSTYWDAKAARSAGGAASSGAAASAAALVSRDRHSTYAVIQVTGASEDARDKAFEEIKDDFEAFSAPGLTVQLGGQVATFHDVNTQVSKDLARAEKLSMPLLLVLLVVIFGSLLAAATPLAVGGIAILGAFLVLRMITLVTDVSVFAINIITMLGLGLAIDYALFMVSRFREEMSQQRSVPDALARTMATAGRTVAFSGVTVAISLASLMFFPQTFLRSMGYGGVAAVLVAMITALTVLPALLAVLGTRIDALRIRVPRALRVSWLRRGSAGEHGVWYRLARSVMRRPIVYAGVIVGLLLLMGSPFLRASFGGVDARVLPTGTESRVVAEALDRDFASNATRGADVVVTGADQTAVQAYAQRLGDVPGVSGATVTESRPDAAKITVEYAADPMSTDARELVDNLRAVPAPDGGEVLVGGQTAVLVDLLDSLGSILPWMGLFVALVTFVLLFLAFGSVVLPAKAIIMNLLSLSASFGALVWIFQDGNLSSVLGFTATGTVEATQPILMLAIAFGLSMDYEVFLLSRVREQWDLTRDNTRAVATGIQKTGGIITSAALLLMIVIGAFSTSGITFIKMIGVGLVIAIVIDATVVRAMLVPATMRLLGAANWWAPAPLARLWQRYGYRETEPTESTPETSEPVPASKSPNPLVGTSA